MPLLSFSQINGENFPEYIGNDLGVTYLPKQTIFKIWAPTASAVKLNLYKDGSGGKAMKIFQMSKQKQGVWQSKIASTSATSLRS